MEELEILLENFWILRGKDRELYHQVRDALPNIANFIEEKLGFRLIVNSQLIKLEKIPAEPEEWMGIQQFKEPLDYAFLCMLLAFLEDKGPEEQFVLSSVTEFIEASFPGEEKVDWTLYTHRKSLVRTLNFAAEIGLIKIDDGDQERFADDRDTEVLYENTGVSRFFFRALGREFSEDFTPEDFLIDEFSEEAGLRPEIRRHRVYRKLLLTPAVYCKSPQDEDFLYIKNIRGTIHRDFEKYLGAALHVHKSSAFLILNRSKYLKSCFPETNSNISDITLLLSRAIREEVESSALKVNVDDSIEMAEPEFKEKIKKIKDRYQRGWYKTYREKFFEKLYEEVVTFLEFWKMIEVEKDSGTVRILPILGKFEGDYPPDFYKKGEVGNAESLDD
ncbi:TIGR02678 family protein [Thermosediminibacter litoriperuensis]|uniref:TIGR02678 family protein n=1 Tax=Thermosediminibacter litoriperuensis TaxID=291989 RepID=UPI0011E83077|nr:TIGR02678 family protein [Thermosediminibacter litoriperuensis]